MRHATTKPDDQNTPTAEQTPALRRAAVNFDILPNEAFVQTPTLLHLYDRTRQWVWSRRRDGLLPPPHANLGTNVGELRKVNAAIMAGATDAEVRALVSSLVAARKLAA